MLICMQKINLITHFFLKILQRNKLLILGNFSISGHTTKMIVSIWRNFWCSKNQLHPFCFLLDIMKILQTCYFGPFEHAWLCTPKVILWTCRKLFVYQQAKSQLHHPRFSGDIAKISNFLFWVLWACLLTQTQKDSINL